MSRLDGPYWRAEAPKLLRTGSPDELERTAVFLYRQTTKALEHQKRFLFDVTDCERMDPGAVLMLMARVGWLFRRGISSAICGGGDAQDAVIEHVDHLFLSQEDRPLFETRLGAGTYHLRAITSELDVSVELEKWSDSVRRGTDRASREDLAVWQTNIGEAAANVFQHSRVERGGEGLDAPLLVIGAATASSVKLAAFDYGAGIPAVVAHAPSPYKPPSGMDDGDLIRHACKRFVTTRDHRTNRGFGLATLVKLVRNRGGRMQILSNNGLAHVSQGRVFSRDLGKYTSSSPHRLCHGTLLTFDLMVGGDGA